LAADAVFQTADAEAAAELVHSGGGPDVVVERMSAVLFGDTMRAWSVTDRLPELWLNPWATKPANPNRTIRDCNQRRRWQLSSHSRIYDCC
jgi:hypothetical protein